MESTWQQYICCDVDAILKSHIKCAAAGTSSVLISGPSPLYAQYEGLHRQVPGSEVTASLPSVMSAVDCSPSRLSFSSVHGQQQSHQIQYVF